MGLDPALTASHLPLPRFSSTWGGGGSGGHADTTCEVLPLQPSLLTPPRPVRTTPSAGFSHAEGQAECPLLTQF